jgi:hypothetical protein
MDKYTKYGWLMVVLLLFYSFGIATSIVSIALDVSAILRIGHVTFEYLLDIFLQVFYVVLNGYIILIVHKTIMEKQECSQG